MRKNVLIISILLGTLTACSSIQPSLTLEDQQKKWDSLQTCASEDTLYQKGVNVQHANQPLHQEARAVISKMLKEAGLEKLESVKGVRGVDPLTPELCTWLYAEHNKDTGEHLSARGCSMQLDSNAYPFIELPYTPLAIKILEFDSRYILLLIDEKGFGGSTLFSLIYDMETDRLMTVDTKKLNTGLPITKTIYQDEKIHYYWTPEMFPRIEDTSCPGKEVATFDLKTGNLQFQDLTCHPPTCADSRHVPNYATDQNLNRWGSHTSLSLNDSGYYMTEAGADFYGSRTKMDAEGWTHLPSLLQQTNLSSFKSLRELGGYSIGNAALCHRFYTQYNTTAKEKQSDERCGLEGIAETTYNWPLAFILQQFDHYLLLYVGEEGLDAPNFYFYSYNLETGNIASADVDFMNTHVFSDIAYKDGKVYFFNWGHTADGYDQKCPLQEMATWDLKTESFAINGDATKYDCPTPAS